MRILIANRGEIARRIIRTARRLGHDTVAVFADPDADAPFVTDADVAVRIGSADLADSYLSGSAILAAAEQAGATAIHPGYGFLSENADFARAVVAAGLIWVGPAPEFIDQMGSKINARRLATAARVAVIPGFDGDQDPQRLATAAAEIGYPVLVKAAAGGGGKGIRIVHDSNGFEAALAEAMAESSRSFGDDAMIVERYVQAPRHVEVQIVGDRHGNVVELGTRECSVQRRYQKVLEEAPAPNLPAETRAGIRTAAADLASSIGYDSVGTVEFVVDADTGDYFFLEMNTRLQVEHPVTEFITGLDLVELQLRSALGEELSLGQADVQLNGHAFEARINAEDPADGFAPQTGTITHLRVPDGARWESGVESGSEISPYYDPMIAKLVVGGVDREAARLRMRRALDELLVGGLVTNAGFHRWLIDTQPVANATVTTRFLDEVEIPGTPDESSAAALAASAWRHTANTLGDAGPWGSLRDFRVTPHRPDQRVFLEDRFGEVHEVGTGSASVLADDRLTTQTEGVSQTYAVDVRGSSVAVAIAGHTSTFRILARTEHWAPSGGGFGGPAGNIVAPFPAVVVEVPASPGSQVAAGDVLVVIEAMKMLHSLATPGPGTVDEVRVAPGDTVASDQTLITFLINDVAEIDDDA